MVAFSNEQKYVSIQQHYSVYMLLGVRSLFLIDQEHCSQNEQRLYYRLQTIYSRYPRQTLYIYIFNVLLSISYKVNAILSNAENIFLYIKIASVFFQEFAHWTLYIKKHCSRNEQHLEIYIMYYSGCLNAIPSRRCSAQASIPEHLVPKNCATVKLNNRSILGAKEPIQFTQWW